MMRAEISNDLAEKGTAIIARKKVRYSRRLVDTLYDHMSDEARACITQKYGGLFGEALLLNVESIAACCALIGTDSDPRACAPESIRGRFGSRGDPERISAAWDWFENAVHRPVDERECMRDIRLIFPEYAEGAG